MNENVKNGIETTLSNSNAPVLILQDSLDIDNIRYLRGNYKTFVVECWSDSMNHGVHNLDWVPRLSEICNKNSDEKVVVVFDGIDRMVGSTGAELAKTILGGGNSKVNLPNNVQFVLTARTTNYDKICSECLENCTIVRTSDKDEVKVIPSIKNQPMTEEAKLAIDRALSDSNNPIFVLQNIGEQNNLDYLKSKHKALIFHCEKDAEDYGMGGDVTGFSLRGNTISGTYKKEAVHSKLNPFAKPKINLVESAPEWYTRLCSMCAQNPDEKVLMVFDNVGGMQSELVYFLSSYTLGDKSDSYPLPSNAQLVFTLDTNDTLEPLYRPFLEWCSVVKTNDRDNISVELYSDFMLDEKLTAALDEGISDSNVPVLIEHENGNRDSIKYLRSKYKFVFAECRTLTDSDIFGNQYKQKNPKWYTKLCDMCIQNPEEKVLMIFDGIGGMTPDMQPKLAQATLDDTKKFVLPDNAQLVFTKSYFSTLGYDENLEKINYRKFMQDCTVVKLYDKDNITVNHLDGGKSK